MSIDKDDILAFVNKRLKENFTEVDDEIKATLADLSKFNLLTAEAVDDPKVSGDFTIDYPELFKKLVSITPNDGSVNRRPMLPIPGGYKEYKNIKAWEQSNSTAGQFYFAEYNKKFYFYPTLTQSFTFTIEFYKHSAGDVGSIEFGDEFANAINYGTCYHAALFRKKTSYIDIWLPIYVAERQSMISLNPPQPSIVGR